MDITKKLHFSLTFTTVRSPYMKDDIPISIVSFSVPLSPSYQHFAEWC